jgi:hypothetical protein
LVAGELAAKLAAELTFGVVALAELLLAALLPLLDFSAGKGLPERLAIS